MGWEASCANALSCVRVIPGGEGGFGVRTTLGAGVHVWFSVVVCGCGGGGLCMWCISACEQRGVWLAVECFCVSNCSERGGGLIICVRADQ